MKSNTETVKSVANLHWRPAPLAGWRH